MRTATIFLALTALAPSLSFSADRPVERKTVAVLAFDNASGRSEYDALGKGLAAMTITDLSSVEEIRLVEREHLQSLTAELDLQRTPYFDPATAARVGRIAGAEYVVAGALAALEPRVRIDARVIRVETGEIVKTAQATGSEKRIFEVQEKLSDELMQGLSVALSPEAAERLRAEREANRVTELHTVLAFSNALDQFDRRDYAGAAAAMYRVSRAAPGSMLVRLTYQRLRARAAAEAGNRLRNGVNRWLGGRVPR
ncbi:MAG TPA: FlgO family outer membrane protein [Longimicrobiaceae bacterium]